MQAKPLLACPMFSVDEAITKPNQPLLRKLPIFPRFPSCWRPIPCRTFLTDLTGQSTLLFVPSSHFLLLGNFILRTPYTTPSLHFFYSTKLPFDSSYSLHIPRRASPAFKRVSPRFFSFRSKFSYLGKKVQRVQRTHLQAYRLAIHNVS